ncbi:DUF6600 domain-containing protein [Paucibacter sp. AS339]|uniref:DUF6600 domain-containing protein n=1 Tax=Paucibacter hankyongi TaxID=3133434 RepID=UPI0030B33155
MFAAALKKYLSVLGLFALMWVAFAATPALADPPTRAGRVAEVIGDAWLFDTEAKEWVRVTRNQTVAEGDRLRTDERARVSLRVGSSSLWLDERSDLEFTQLDEGRVLLLLAKGDLGLRLRSQEAVNEYKVQTREGMFYAEREGLFRVEQLDRGSRAYTFQGRNRFEFNRGESTQPVWLQDGEQAEFWWAGGPRTERQRLSGDGFGDWMLAQSRAEGDSFASGASQRYVSPEMTGAEDLDRHGRWESSPEYGNVWIPSVVAVGWAPYRHGRWAWSRHWGWTWVDDAPWGFAPFHYGRWVSWGGRWCWSPGVYVSRPVYAPALVAWVGGPSVSIGINIGGGRPPRPHYGWYPLAPREVYVPHYQHSPAYKHRINVDPDPVTVRKPRSNFEVSGAVSYLPGQGAGVQAMPAKELGPVRPLPSAPARQDLATVMPARPVVESNVQRPPADMAWRSENLGRRERERDRERATQDGVPQRAPGLAVMPPAAATLPGTAPAVSAPRPGPETRGDAQGPRPADSAWRGRDAERAPVPQNPQPNRDESRDRLDRIERADRAERADRLERAERADRIERLERAEQTRRATERAAEAAQPDRNAGPSRAPVFERPPERPVERQVERPRAMEAPAMPQVPRPQMEPARPVQAQPQAPRQDDAGPRRGRAEDGQKPGGERRRGEAER